MIGIDHDNNIITLTWVATAGAAFYDIHRVHDGGPDEHFATVDAAMTTFVDDPAPDGILDYQVAADGHPAMDCPVVSGHLGGEPPPEDEPVCVGGVTASEEPDGSIRVTWTPISGVLSYDVVRAVGAGPLVPHALFDGSVVEFVDTTDIEKGKTYRYAVMGNGLVRDNVRCQEAEVTTVPFFSSLLGATLAGAVGAMAVVHLGRHRRR